MGVEGLPACPSPLRPLPFASAPTVPQPDLGRCTVTWCRGAAAAVVWGTNGFWTLQGCDMAQKKQITQDVILKPRVCNETPAFSNDRRAAHERDLHAPRGEVQQAPRQFDFKTATHDRA